MNPRDRWPARIGLTAVEVAGESMLPTYGPGDWLLLRRTTRVRPGDVVAVADPRDARRLLVKRIDRPVPGGWWLLGDRPDRSTDSRTFGAVPPDAVIGKVLLRYRRGPRARG